MTILCGLAGHRADGSQTYNGGFHFSRCRRCRRDMIRCGGDWRLVPRGHRVVWRSGRHAHSIEPDYDKVRPVLVNRAALPAVEPAFLSWSRQLVRKARRSAGGAGAAAIEAEAREDAQYPAWLVIAALAAAGLQALLSLGAGRRDFA